MTDKPSPSEEQDARTETPSQSGSVPSGAVLVTTFLALVILLSWFGMFTLNLIRG